MCRTLEGDYGILDVSQLEDKIRPVNEHLVRTIRSISVPASYAS